MNNLLMQLEPRATGTEENENVADRPRLFSPRCRSTKAAKMDLTLVSGAWPLHPPSPHATLVVVPGMRQTAAHARNVVQNVRRMGKEPFSCLVFLYESIPLDTNSRASGALVKQVCTVMRWVGRNVIDYLKLLDANVTRGFGGGVLVSMQAGLHKWPMPNETEASFSGPGSSVYTRAVLL